MKYSECRPYNAFQQDLAAPLAAPTIVSAPAGQPYLSRFAQDLTFPLVVQVFVSTAMICACCQTKCRTNPPLGLLTHDHEKSRSVAFPMSPSAKLSKGCFLNLLIIGPLSKISEAPSTSCRQSAVRWRTLRCRSCYSCYLQVSHTRCAVQDFSDRQLILDQTILLQPECFRTQSIRVMLTSRHLTENCWCVRHKLVFGLSKCAVSCFR